MKFWQPRSERDGCWRDGREEDAPQPRWNTFAYKCCKNGTRKLAVKSPRPRGGERGSFAEIKRFNGSTDEKRGCTLFTM